MTTFGISGLYPHTETHKDVIMFPGGAIYELMVKVAHKIYQHYVIMSSNGKPLLYVQIQKASYGLPCSAVLFYRNLVKDPEAYGLQIRPYDPCVAKKMRNSKHMKVVWHMDY